MSDQELGISVTIDAELARFEANMREAGRIVEVSSTGMDRSTRRAAQAFGRLEAALDPTARAAVRLERDTAKVQRALDAGVVSSERAAAVQRRLNDQYEQTIARLTGVTTANTRAMGAVEAGSRRLSAATSRQRRYGLAVQNAGFQVGDFAVQVASGTSAVRAMAQQLPQLLGGFGVWGSVVGAAVAVGAALGTVVTDLVSGNDDAADATQSHSDAMERAREIMDELNEAGQTREEQLRRERDRALETARSEIALAEARLAVAETAIDPETAFAVAGVERETLRRLRQQLTELEEEYADFEDVIGRVSRTGRDAETAIDRLDDRINDLWLETQVARGELSEFDAEVARQAEVLSDAGVSAEDANAALIQYRETLEEHAEATQRAEAAQEALNEQQREADNAAREAERALEDYARSVERAADRVAGSIERTLSDTLFDTLRGETRDFWEDFKEFSLRAVADVAAQIARTTIIQPIVQTVVGSSPGLFGVQGTSGVVSANNTGFSGLSGIGSVFQPNAFSIRGFDSLVSGINSFFNIGGPATQIGTGINQVGNAIAGTSSAPGSAGLFGLGDFGTAAGLGIGTTVLGLLSGQGVGQSLLQGGLTGIGGLVGGPIGAAAGGLLGNLFGGLFGSRRPPDSTSVFDLNVATGGLTFRGGKGGTSEQEQAARQILQQLSGFQSVLEALDASLDVTSEIMIGFSSKYSDFINVGRGQENIGTRNDPQAVLDALFDRLVPTITGLDPAIQRILSQSSANDFAALAQELAEAGQFLELYNNLVDQATLSQGEIAIQAIEEQFEALFEQAERMGLALEPLIELRDREIAAIEAQGSLQPQILADTLAAGEAIRAFLNSQAVSDLSSLSPTQRLAEAQSQFGANLDLVRGGDLNAIGSLTQSASALLEIGREQFASSVSFAALETTVRSSLAQLGVDLTSDAAIADRAAAAVEAQTLTLADQNERLIDEVGRMREELTAIKRELREAA